MEAATVKQKRTNYEQEDRDRMKMKMKTKTKKTRFGCFFFTAGAHESKKKTEAKENSSTITRPSIDLRVQPQT